MGDTIKVVLEFAEALKVIQSNRDYETLNEIKKSIVSVTMWDAAYNPDVFSIGAPLICRQLTGSLWNDQIQVNANNIKDLELFKISEPLAKSRKTII